jgi:folylpolyglutamate synthase/dihydropteroate synthase
MGGVATMSAEYMRRRVKAQMQDGDYVQLWQQMSNAPVPDRLALVKRNSDTTVDWEHFGNVWLEMFADEESNDVNLWKLVEHEQICAVINCLKDKQVSCASEPCTRSATHFASVASGRDSSRTAAAREEAAQQHKGRLRRAVKPAIELAEAHPQTPS